jgi:hypothetical protein
MTECFYNTHFHIIRVSFVVYGCCLRGNKKNNNRNRQKDANGKIVVLLRLFRETPVWIVSFSFVNDKLRRLVVSKFLFVDV